jgi:hypothetical protein
MRPVATPPVLLQVQVREPDRDSTGRRTATR